MTEREDVGYQQVTCRDCGRSYQCTPFDDYYDFTTTADGQCTRCLMVSHGLKRDARIITTVVPGPQDPSPAVEAGAVGEDASGVPGDVQAGQREEGTEAVSDRERIMHYLSAWDVPGSDWYVAEVEAAMAGLRVQHPDRNWPVRLHGVSEIGACVECDALSLLATERIHEAPLP